MAFGQMPKGWIENGVLKQFSAEAGVVGRSIAALKCYIAIAAFRDFRQEETVLSLYDLQVITGASRPTVLEGLTIVEAMGLVEKLARADRNTNVYQVGSTDVGFRKVPQDVINERLREISNRGAAALDALKLYVAMLYHRDESDNRAKISHKTLIDYTGVRPEAVAAGNSILHAHRFVTVRQDETSLAYSGHPMNAYILHGDFGGNQRRCLRPSEARSRDRRAKRAA